MKATLYQISDSDSKLFASTPNRQDAERLARKFAARTKQVMIVKLCEWDNVEDYAADLVADTITHIYTCRGGMA